MAWPNHPLAVVPLATFLHPAFESGEHVVPPAACRDSRPATKPRMLLTRIVVNHEVNLFRRMHV
jgi:hypothetical protein